MKRMNEWEEVKKVLFLRGSSDLPFMEVWEGLGNAWGEGKGGNLFIMWDVNVWTGRHGFLIAQ